jgi:hypothetical protein
MSQVDLRPLSMGELLDRTFSLYRRHFALFIGIAAIPHLLVLALQLTQLALMPAAARVALPPASQFQAASRALSTGGTLGFIGLALLGVIVYVVAYLFSQGGTVFAVSELYLGRTTTIIRSLARVRGELGSLLGVIILNGLVTGFCFILLIIPGIYMACRLCVCVPAALLENLGPRESLERSFRLTKDNAGRAFLIFLLYVVILYAAILVFNVPFLFALQTAKNDPAMQRVWLALTQVGSFVAGVLISPVLTIALALFYFDLRVRKEGFDLQLMMHPLGEGVPAAPPPSNLLS